MYLIEKEFNIAISHRLSCHKGLCKFLHGHNLQLLVGVMSDKLNSDGMVIDFSELKRIVNEGISEWDHAAFFNSSDSEFVEFSKKNNLRLKLVDGDPTSENLCRLLFNFVEMKLDMEGYSNVKIHHVTIYETNSSKCTYTGDNKCY